MHKFLNHKLNIVGVSGPYRNRTLRASWISPSFRFFCSEYNAKKMESIGLLVAEIMNIERRKVEPFWGTNFLYNEPSNVANKMNKNKQFGDVLVCNLNSVSPIWTKRHPNMCHYTRTKALDWFGWFSKKQDGRQDSKWPPMDKKRPFWWCFGF